MIFKFFCVLLSRALAFFPFTYSITSNYHTLLVDWFCSVPAPWAFFEIWIHFIIFKIMCVFLFFLIHVSHHFELSDTFAPLILLSFLFYTLLYVSHTSHHFALTGTLVLLIFLSQTQYIYFILNPHPYIRSESSESSGCIMADWVASEFLAKSARRARRGGVRGYVPDLSWHRKTLP